jgi:heme exporter protein D
MRNLDFSSWNGTLTTLLGLVLVSVVAVGIRLLLMQTIQRRRERENRQINERLRTLIAAYKILGGSFTGELHVDPAHLRGSRQQNGNAALDIEPIAGNTETGATLEAASSERRRRIRDAVEAALSDVILLGTEEQVNLAAHAAREMVAGNKVHLSELIVSLRNFIRQALDLEPILAELHIPDTRDRSDQRFPAAREVAVGAVKDQIKKAAAARAQAWPWGPVVSEVWQSGSKTKGLEPLRKSPGRRRRVGVACRPCQP